MGYGVVSRIFHWLTVLMVFTMIPVGLIIAQDLLPRWYQNKLFILHKGLGVVVLSVVALRLVWRGISPPPPLPATVPRAQRLAASAVHAGLYVLLLTMAISGYVHVIAGGFPIELLNTLGVPPLIEKNVPLATTAKAFHVTTAFVLIAVILVHVAAASYHGLVRRDGVVHRMWPPFRKRRA